MADGSSRSTGNNVNYYYHTDVVYLNAGNRGEGLGGGVNKVYYVNREYPALNVFYIFTASLPVIL